MIFDGIGIIVCIILAYIIFIRFITNEGIKQIELSKEMELAGHPPIIRIDKNGQFEELKITQLPLLTLLNSEFKTVSKASRLGDLYVIYSDGIIETTNKKGVEFGFERFKKILEETYSLPTQEISVRIYKELNAYGSGHDDQSLILIRKKK